MAEYCEYMWDPNRGHMSSSLVRSIYDEEGRRFDKRDKKLAITIVRAILRGMPDVDLKHCTDEYITRFLLARKYRTEQAAALIAAYQAQLAHRQDIFGNLTARDPALQRALRAGIPGVLPARDRKGRCVLVILASQWDPIAVPALSVQRAIFLVLETLIQDPRNQQSGFVTVVDWSGFSLRQGGALGAAALRNLIAALRGRFPARFKAIHFLAAPLYVQATLALVKPFLDEKTRNKIYLHGNNLSTLHQHLPTDILPAELGGTGPAFNPGLWAEPVIHSAMKEAEFAAAKKDKEHAQKLEKKENLSTTADCETIESRNTENEKRSLSEAMNITVNNYGKSINEQHEDVFNKNNLELNFMNGRTNGEDITEDPKVKSNVDASTFDASKFERTQNSNYFRDDIDVIDNTSRTEADDGDLGNEPEHFKEDDLSLMELHSETNSNEFEMIPSRPDSDGSKDSSLDNRSERVFLNVAKNDVLSEKTNLIT